jgi:GT2 family glycosyltransferase
MKCSLLVATTNRLSLTERLLRSLAVQEHTDFEVVFVHEVSCAEKAADLAEAFRARLDIRPLPVPRCGISKARNLGMPLLRGDLIAFPDDDCVYPPDTLSEVVSLFRAHPEADALLAARAGLDERLPAKSGARVPSRVNRYALFGCSETFLQFYRAPCVRNVGLFDETLGAGTGLPYGCGEDTDYALRAAAAGFTVLRAPWLRVRHPCADLGDPSLAAKVDAYAAGRMRLLRKHALPLWFRIANVAYPLAALARELPGQGRRSLSYRWRMFAARLANF